MQSTRRGSLSVQLAHVAQPRDRVVGGRELVADLDQQLLLLREVGVARREAGVLAHLERLALRLAGGGEAGLVAARNHARARGRTAPQDQALELRGFRVTEVPGEGVETSLGRERLGGGRPEERLPLGIRVLVLLLLLR